MRIKLNNQKTTTTSNTQTVAPARLVTVLLFAVLTAGLGLIANAASAQEISPDELQQVIDAQNARIKIVEKISAPTLAVFGPDGGGGGSGVIVTPDGYALTNYHVTQPCGDYMRCGMNDGKLYDAVIVGIDPTGDVALIKLLGRDDFPTAELGDSDQLEPGQWCIVAGNPFLLANDFKPTITYGIISGTHRYQYPSGTLLEYADCIQTDASINPGNSGGPLFNADGQLVGINGRCSFEKRGRVNVGVGYAISINQIKKFYGYLRSGRIVDHATLGATVGTDEDGRVVVTDILESSDAYRRGLRYDDEIISLGGKPVRNANEFKNILGTYPRGWQIPISFRSDGERLDKVVRLAGVHSREELLGMIQKSPVELKIPGQEKDKPDDEEEGENQEDTDKEDSQLEKMRRLLQAQKKAKPKPKYPGAVGKQIVSRRGYANYFFNQSNVERIWKKTTGSRDLSKKTGEWLVTGNRTKNLENRNAAKPFELILRNDEAFADWPETGYRINLDGDLDLELGPDAVEGLALSISIWRRLLVLGPKNFGDVFFLGTMPSDDRGSHENQNDVLVGTHDATESYFHFDQKTGELLRMEMFPTVNVDPCELIFADYKNGLPRQITVRKGNRILAELLDVSVALDGPAGAN